MPREDLRRCIPAGNISRKTTGTLRLMGRKASGYGGQVEEVELQPRWVPEAAEHNATQRNARNYPNHNKHDNYSAPFTSHPLELTNGQNIFTLHRDQLEP